LETKKQLGEDLQQFCMTARSLAKTTSSGAPGETELFKEFIRQISHEP